MSKNNIRLFCTNCGGTVFKMMGKCPHCQSWNTIQEEIQTEIKPSARHSFTKLGTSICYLDTVKYEQQKKQSTGIKEFDRVLGGGLVNGSTLLIGGDPGVGKSTLLLQLISNFASCSNVLYISGEESIEQIAARATRLNIPVKNIAVYSEIECNAICSAILNQKTKFVIIDSIQTLYNSDLSSAPGTVSQVKECASRLNRLAKEHGITIIMVCHVTKEGEFAGPRVLEHIVDTVLYFEGEKINKLRAIRAIKNRFGPINEVGLFLMSERGLEEVIDPSNILIQTTKLMPGAVFCISQEGNRPLAVEIQALLDSTPLPNPIRRSIGLDLNRLQMLCAIINKYYNIPIYSNNVFVSTVGGFKLIDTGSDLPSFIAMFSSYKNISIPEKTAIFGEIGLTGEIRQVLNFEDRIKEACRIGMKRIILPIINCKKLNRAKYPIEIMECANLNMAIEFSLCK